MHFSSVEKLIIENRAIFLMQKQMESVADIHFSSADVYFIQLLACLLLKTETNWQSKWSPVLNYIYENVGFKSDDDLFIQKNLSEIMMNNKINLND